MSSDCLYPFDDLGSRPGSDMREHNAAFHTRSFIAATIRAAVLRYHSLTVAVKGSLPRLLLRLSFWRKSKGEYSPRRGVNDTLSNIREDRIAGVRRWLWGDDYRRRDLRRDRRS